MLVKDSRSARFPDRQGFAPASPYPQKCELTHALQASGAPAEPLLLAPRVPLAQRLVRQPQRGEPLLAGYLRSAAENS